MEMMLAGAEIGQDPDEGDEGVDQHGKDGMPESDRDGEEIEAEGEPVFALGGGVLTGALAGEAKAPLDGETEQHEGEAAGEEGQGIEDDGEAVVLFFQNPGGEVGEQRGAEQEEEIAVEDAAVDFFNAVDKEMVIDPVDAGEGEGEDVDEEDGKDGVEAGGAVLVGDFKLENHDGDDDGQHTVRKGFETGRGERSGVGVVSHDLRWLHYTRRVQWRCAAAFVGCRERVLRACTGDARRRGERQAVIEARV